MGTQAPSGPGVAAGHPSALQVHDGWRSAGTTVAGCPQDGPRRGWPGRVPWAALLAGTLGAAWWVVSPRTPDLAAQAYRVTLFERAGFVLWDDSWYAGHHIPGYSLTFPALASLIGMRVLGVLAVVCSAWLFAVLLRRLFGPRTLPASLWFAVAAAGDLWIGRLTFALGVTCAVGAGLAHLHGRRLAGAVPGAPGAGSRARAPVRARRAAWRALAGCAAVLAAATSPVAGLILALAAASWALGDALAGSPARAVRAHLAGALAPRLREVAPLLGGPVITVLAMQALFPEGGFEPYAASSLAAALAVTLAFIVALPRDERVLRTAAWIYVPVNLLCEIPTAMGSNVQRYGILLAGPLLLGVLAQGRTSRAGRPLLVALLAGMATWVVWGPIVQTAEVIGEPSTRSAYYAPVERFLVRASAAGPIRVEVPFTRAHWEAALLAPSVPLARGWERQLDKRYNLSLESSTLTAAQYRSWLDRYGVRFVALPDAPLDQSSFAEARLIRSGLPYLREIFRNVHWRVFEVLGAAPLAVRLAGAGRGGAAAVAKQPRLLALTHTGFRLYASGPGRYLVKVHYTPYWQVIAGRGTVHSGPGGFTEVDAGGSGELAVRARFSLGGAWGALAMALEVL